MMLDCEGRLKEGGGGGIGRLASISWSPEGFGSVTKVIGTDDDERDISVMCMEGTMVISSGISAARDDSRSAESGGGGGLLSGGCLGLPN